jgi:hypothetical protein
MFDQKKPSSFVVYGHAGESYFWDDFPGAMYRPQLKRSMFHNSPGSLDPSQAAAGLRKSLGVVSRFYEWMDVTNLASGLGFCRSCRAVGQSGGRLAQKHALLFATIFSTAAPVKPALTL